MDLAPHIDRFARRLAEVEAALSSPEAFAVPQRAQELSREYSRLKELVANGRAFLRVGEELADNREMAASEPPGSELGTLAAEEIRRLEVEENRLKLEVQRGLLPPDPTDSRNTIVEIRAGAGGAESALFAADLFRMYSRYAEARGWQVDPMDSSASDLGGFQAK
jgi:peptide chain release factor 1